MHRLGSYSNPANVRSTRALLGVGFTHEGVLRHWHRHGEDYYDVNVFGMLRSDWETGPLADVPGDGRGRAAAGVRGGRRDLASERGQTRLATRLGLFDQEALAPAVGRVGLLARVSPTAVRPMRPCSPSALIMWKTTPVWRAWSKCRPLPDDDVEEIVGRQRAIGRATRRGRSRRGTSVARSER